MNRKCFGRARARREAEDLLLGGVLRVVVTVPFFVVVMPLGFALLALTSLLCFVLNQRVLLTKRSGNPLRHTKLET